MYRSRLQTKFCITHLWIVPFIRILFGLPLYSTILIFILVITESYYFWFKWSYVFLYTFIKLELTEEEIRNLTLIEIENLLQENWRSLKEFKGMPYPNSYVTRHTGNWLIYEEHDYNVDTEQQTLHDLFHSLTGNLFTTTINYMSKISYWVIMCYIYW